MYKGCIYNFLRFFDREKCSASIEDAMIFRYKAAKAVLLSCSTMLIRIDAYVVSYEERVKRAVALSSEISDIKEITDWALSEKLTPSEKGMTLKECENLFFKVRAFFCAAFKKSIATHRLYTNPVINDLFQHIYWKNIAKQVLDVLEGTFERREYILMSIAQSYLFYSFEKNGQNIRYMRRAWSILSKLRRIDKPFGECEWDDLRKAATYQ